MATFYLEDLQNQNFVVPCAGVLTGIVCSVDSQKKPSCTSAPILDEYSKPIPYSEDTQEIFSVGKIGEITYFGIRNKDQGIQNQCVNLVILDKFTVGSEDKHLNIQSQKVAQICYAPTESSRTMIPSISSILLKKNSDNNMVELFIAPKSPYLTHYMIYGYTYTTVYQIASKLVILSDQATSSDIFMDPKFHFTDSLISMDSRTLLLSGVYETSDYPKRRKQAISQSFRLDQNGKYKGEKVKELQAENKVEPVIGYGRDNAKVVSKDFDSTNGLYMKLLKYISSVPKEPLFYGYIVRLENEKGQVIREVNDPALQDVVYELSGKVAYSELGQIVTILYRVKRDNSSQDYSSIALLNITDL